MNYTPSLQIKNLPVFGEFNSCNFRFKRGMDSVNVYSPSYFTCFKILTHIHEKPGAQCCVRNA